MEIIKSKQWSLAARDFVKSLFYAVIVPVFTIAQYVVDKYLLDASISNEKLILFTAISAALAHLIRKFSEQSKVVTVQPYNGDGNPPPMGDPTHPSEEPEPEPCSNKIASREGKTPPPIGDPTHPKT